MISRKKEYYRGIPTAPYDLVKEFLLAMAVITALVVALALVFSSPDEPPLTIRQVAQQDPQGFVSTALSELNGTSAIAGYGPPYDNGSTSVQYLSNFSPQRWFGIRLPINTAQDFVLGPLSQISVTSGALQSALSQYSGASAAQHTQWSDAYSVALGKATVRGSALTVPACACGPVSVMMTSMLALGESGGMDGQLLTSTRFYRTDYTQPLLFMADDTAVANHAAQFNLLGTQWGVMNETGNYPGQAWLWLYTTLYQMWPFNVPPLGATAGDLAPMITISVLSLLLLLVPWIPGLNRLPRYLGVYRLIWRDYYRDEAQQPPHVEAG
jgi:hypothetical protein